MITYKEINDVVEKAKDVLIELLLDRSGLDEYLIGKVVDKTGMSLQKNLVDAKEEEEKNND